MSMDRRTGSPAISFVAVIGPLAALAAGCGLTSDGEPPPRPEAPVRIVEYNVKAVLTFDDEPARSARIASQVASFAPALMAFSECAPCAQLLEQMPGGHQLVTADRDGVAAAFDPSRWRAGDHGFLTLGENDDGWGERVALWVELEEIATGAPILFYSTHWCVSHRRPDDACDLDRLLGYARKIIDDAASHRPSTPVIVAGDFNVREGPESDAMLGAFTDAGYVDTLRAIHPTGDLITLEEGFRVDYVFASAPVDVLDAYVDQTVPFALGSDHWPVVSTVHPR
jgi:endonuclease/exonuclease/phosphatase family metal-dependent hydrolase